MKEKAISVKRAWELGRPAVSGLARCLHLSLQSVPLPVEERCVSPGRGGTRERFSGGPGPTGQRARESRERERGGGGSEIEREGGGRGREGERKRE